jgi:hypothetical protein
MPQPLRVKTWILHHEHLENITCTFDKFGVITDWLGLDKG